MLKKVIDIILKAKNIGITFHQSPDGDSLGSSLALLQGLLKVGKKAYIISKEELPKDFEFLPYSKEVNTKNNFPNEETDLVIALDCGNVDRLNGDLSIENKKFTLINLDHHISNDRYGDINYIDTKCAAVGEIVFELLKTMSIEIDKDIATCLYTALLTDTGSFKYSNTTKNTHYIAGELIQTGFDFSEIHRTLFENISINRLKLQGDIINNIDLQFNGKVCSMTLTLDNLKKHGLDSGDTSDIISIGTKISSVEVTILLKEFENGTKVSLRSKSYVDVRKIAEIYDGGGHVKASGFKSELSINEIKPELLRLIEKELVK
ncbi:bifunctional oligoribonuclease/PAP phosphatase NrnA [Clostridium sediminicola]|uniref:DHH family phosphoesterase n=1 Tax=Clostridium sediminicola TaxID=3114879 RepID=UPI0031F20542